MITDEMVRALAVAYANAWSADIKLYLKQDCPTWDTLGPAAQTAMIRVSRAALTATLPLPVAEGLQAMSDAETWVPHEPATWPWRVGTLLRDVTFRTWHGHGANPDCTTREVPKGTPVKIVMVSRFGDVGITTDLSADRGYSARVDLADIAPPPCAPPEEM